MRPCSGVWIGLTLAGVAWIGMELFTSRPAGDAWPSPSGAPSSWTLTALPLFIWMGEILFRTRLSEDMFKGLAPWLQAAAGAPAAHQRHRLHHLRRVSGLQRRHLRHHRQDDAARAEAPRLPRQHGHRLAGRRGTLGLLIPPSIIMIVYGVAADVSIAKLFIGRRAAGLLLAACSRATSSSGRCATPDQVRPPMPT
jgi:C4-dicarboxylate transporter DctM subunit